MPKSKQNNPVRDVIQVDSELLDSINFLIQEQRDQGLRNIFADLHSADIAEIINHLNVDNAKYSFQLLDTEVGGEVLPELDENLREKLLKQIEPEKITEIFEELEDDDAADIVNELPEPVAEHVLENIGSEQSEDVKLLMQYREDTAGGIMNSDFVFVQDTATVGDATEEVRKNAEEFEHIYYIYVLTKNEKLVGVVSLKSLLINASNKPISEVMEEDLIYVTPEIDQEEVANIIEKYNLVSIPVVNENKVMLGRITVDDIVDVIQEEASEDIQKIAGLSEEQEASDTIFRITRIRLPWLLLALAMEIIAAVVLSKYEHIITRMVVATFFIPIVMAMGGSTGTQAAIVMVRGLSSGDIWINESLKKLSKEFMVAMLNGIACSLILLLATTLFFSDSQDYSVYFALVLSVALLTIIIFATMVGATIPVILKKMGFDPALATGPFVTATNDILGLIIYIWFIIAFFFS
ncbi:MAG: magnesium transporter [Ignavibacteria bacterium]|jgi:magnesium transporter